MSRSADEVQSLLNTQIPEILWHYTSLAGAKGIIESDCLWVTDIRFLNDTQEYIHAIELVELVANEIEDVSDREMVLECVRYAHSMGELSANYYQVFVASFSEAKDLLSQWRAYTEDCKGISLGFELQTWRPEKSSDSMASLAPCVYNDNEKKTLVRSVLKHLLDEAGQISKELEQAGNRLVLETLGTTREQFDLIVTDSLENEKNAILERLNSARNATLIDLARIMPLLKHSSFAEEREWRLVLPYDATKIHTLIKKKMRVGKSSLLPYIEMPLGRASGLSLLKKVVVGPTPVMERAVNAVNIFMKWNDLNEIAVESSSTSYRSW